MNQILNLLIAENGIVNVVAFIKFTVSVTYSFVPNFRGVKLQNFGKNRPCNQTQNSSHLLDVIPTTKRAYFRRYDDKLPRFKLKHNYFKNSFFPSTAAEWNKLDLNIRNSESLTNFKGNILKFIRPSQKSAFLCNNPKEKLLLDLAWFKSSSRK